MRKPRAALAIVVLLALVAVLVLFLARGADDEPGDAFDRDGASTDALPMLRGTGTAGTDAAPEATPAPSGQAARGEALVNPTPPTAGAWDVEVLDYREAGVAGVEVFHEIDLVGAASGGAGAEWKVLARGTTDAKGRVYLAVDPGRRRLDGEGLNHRLRLVPPEEREDLHPTWKIWMPRLPYTFRMSQTHTVAGRVLDREGEPVWAATVWVGDLPEGGHAIVNPDWRETKTDVDGWFRFEGIPTTSDWRIDVWAVGPGEEKPASSRQVRGAQNVALDDLVVEVRLQ